MLGPFEFIRAAVEKALPNIGFSFAASLYNSALMIFDDLDDREALVARSPMHFAGINVSFVRPEDTEDRGLTAYSLFVEIAMSGYPLELWHEAGAAFILGHVGWFRCVDRTCFASSDRSSMRGFVQIEPVATIPPALLCRLPNNDLLTVRLHVIQSCGLGLGTPFRPNKDPSPPGSPRSGGVHGGSGAADQAGATRIPVAPRPWTTSTKTRPLSWCPSPMLLVPRQTATAPNSAATLDLDAIAAETDVAHDAAVAAAKALVRDAEDLVHSIHDVALSSFSIGSTSSAPLSCHRSSAPPSPAHENEERKSRVRAMLLVVEESCRYMERLEVYGNGTGERDAGAYDDEEEEEDDELACGGARGCAGGLGEKKRRLAPEQVRALERSFEADNKLDPERKARIARDLLLHPRQVAVWFQNRRARWKTKQIERDFTALRSRHDALRHECDSLRRDKDALAAEIRELREKVEIKQEMAVKPEQLPSSAAAAAVYKQDGSTDSDSSAVLNEEASPYSGAAFNHHNHPPQPSFTGFTSFLGAPSSALTLSSSFPSLYHGSHLEQDDGLLLGTTAADELGGAGLFATDQGHAGGLSWYGGEGW